MNTGARIIAIIQYLSKTRRLVSLTELSNELKLDKSGVYRLLSSMKAAQWVIQDRDTEKYILGSGILGIALSFLSNLDIVRISRSYLEELRELSEETAFLNIRIGYERIVVDQVNTHHELLYQVALGRRAPLWKGAPGKAMMAYLTDVEIKEVLEKIKESKEQYYASGEAIDIEKISAELPSIREKGFAVAAGERVPGAVAVAAPIFSHQHIVIGSISFAAPMYRINLDQVKKYGPKVKQFANDISNQLGHNRP